LTQKMQYFDLTAQWQPTKENIKTANDCKSQYKNILKIIEPLRQKGQQFLNEVDKNYEMG
jgi:hypothetical protein